MLKGIVNQVVASSLAQHNSTAPSGAMDYPLASIKLRDADTRELDLERVVELVDSISEIGLCQGLTVDLSGKLIAGRHRLEALRQLKEYSPDEFLRHFTDSRIPVHVLDFLVDEDPERALLAEAAENCNRKNYTREEVNGIAARLIGLGYVVSSNRPKKGQKALHPAVAKIFGKSDRWVRQMLREAPPDEEEDLAAGDERSEEVGESESKGKQIDPSKQIKSCIRSARKAHGELSERKKRGDKAKILELEEIISRLEALLL